jgi:hypothetical protein
MRNTVRGRPSFRWIVVHRVLEDNQTNIGLRCQGSSRNTDPSGTDGSQLREHVSPSNFNIAAKLRCDGRGGATDADVAHLNATFGYPPDHVQRGEDHPWCDQKTRSCSFHRRPIHARYPLFGQRIGIDVVRGMPPDRYRIRKDSPDNFRVHMCLCRDAGESQQIGDVTASGAPS